MPIVLTRNKYTELTPHCKWLLLPAFLLLFITNVYSAEQIEAEEIAENSDATVNNSQQLWNLENADIRAVINQVSEITGKNFLVDPQVSGEVTIVSTQPLTTAEVYPVFLSMLQSLGYSAIDEGEVIRILPDNISLANASLVGADGSPIPRGEVVIQLIDVKYVSVEQLVPFLRPLLPPTGYISAYAPSNMLIVAGPSSSVQHIAAIVNRVDVFNDNDFEVEIIPLQNAIAADMVQTLQSLLSSRDNGGSFGQVYLAADDASNTILLSGNLDRRLYIRVLISQLDSRSEYALDRETEVIYLKYVQANDVVPILASVARANFGSVGTTVGNAPSLPTNSPGFNTTQTNLAGISNAIGSNITPYPNQYNRLDGLSPAFNQNLNSGFSTGRTGNTQNFTAGATTTITMGEGGENTVEIAADPNINAIIVTGPTDLIRALKSVLARIDIRPAQVLVEALIVEISENRMLDLGVDWQTRPFNDFVDDTITDNATSSFATLGAGFGMGFIRAGDIEIIIQALRQDSNTHVLSTPSLVVLDNQEAAISVGQTVAFPTGSFTTAGDVVNPFTTFTREDVALSLAVIPQVNQDSSVSLQIFHENETVDPTSSFITINGQPVGIPTTNKSEIQTSVIVEDGDVLVLGGLISNQQQNARRSTPFLSSIPGLGLLFQARLNNEDRRNLMVFLRPQILHTPEDGIQVTDRKYQYIRNQQVITQHQYETRFIPEPWEVDIYIPEPFNPVVQ